jgi:hypothetical protein
MLFSSKILNLSLLLGLPCLSTRIFIDILFNNRLINDMHSMSSCECQLYWFILQKYWQLKWVHLLARPTCLVSLPPLLLTLLLK